MVLNLMRMCVFVLVGLLFQAQVSVSGPGGVDEREGLQKVFAEGERGWDEDGVNLWTAVSPLPLYNVGIGTSTPTHKLDIVGNTRVQGLLYINSWPIQVNAEPSVGQVLKWTGSAFVPQDDAGVGDCEWLDAGSYLYPRDQSAGEVRIYEDATSAKISALQTSAIYAAIRGSHSLGPFGELGLSSYGVYGQYNASIYGYLGAPNSGVRGISNDVTGAGVFGDGGTVTSGVYGQTNTSADYGVFGVNLHASGTGVVGLGSNVNLVVGSGQGDGVIGVSDAYGVVGSNYNGVNTNRWGILGSSYYGAYGESDNLSGAGVGGFYTGTGDGVGVYGRSVPADYNGFGGYFVGGFVGVRGIVNPTGNQTYYGVYGSATGGSGTNYGVYGYVSSSTSYGAGALGQHAHSSGTGVIGLGNALTTFWTLTVGSGGAFTGSQFGVYGRSTTTSAVARAGGYFENAAGVYAYVAHTTAGGTNFKIVGAGTVSTIMETRRGKKTLFAPESPEAFIIDFGEGRLENGRATIYLDPLFLDCITVDKDYDIKVFVQLREDCNGVYVRTMRDRFEVIELNGGKSNASFSYMVVGKWKGYENLRFPDAPEPLKTIEHVATPDRKKLDEKAKELPELKVVELKREIKKLMTQLEILEREIKTR
ncbi:MAG: hypothetical protein ABDH49_07450 [Candidatus Hydrothermales bacterium]